MKLDTLADGSLIASFGPETAAFDAIVRLARSALSLSALLPRARIVLATARGLSGGGAAPADVVDRAAEILGRQAARSEADAPAITVERSGFGSTLSKSTHSTPASFSSFSSRAR